MPSSARDELMDAVRSPTAEPRNMPPLAVVNRVITHADLTLAALVEEHGLHEVLRMLGGESLDIHVHGPWCGPYCDIVTLEWGFPVPTEGDSDE